MNEEQFNKFFRDKLSKYPSSVPDDMWERIQGKKKRRIFFWWLFSGILFISFTAGYFVFQTNTYKTNDKGHGSDKGYVSIDKQKASGNNKDSVRISNTEKNILLQQIKRDSEIGESGTLKSLMNMVTTTPAPAAKGNFEKGDHRRNYRGPNAPFTVSKNSYVRKSRLTEKQQPSSVITNDASKNDTTKEKDALTADAKNHENTTAENKSTVKITIEIPVPLAKDSSRKIEALKDSSFRKNNTVITKKGLFLIVYFSPAIAINKFTPGITSYPVTYLKTIYKTKLSYNAGATIGKTFGENFSIETGLLYSQVNMILQTLDSAHLKIKGKYRNIDVPIIASYNIWQGNFTTTIHAGMIFNLSASSQGSAVYDSTGNPVNTYRTNAGISLYLGLCFAKRLTNSIDLVGESYFMYRPSYITKQEIAFKQQINMAAISFGLRYNF